MYFKINHQTYHHTEIESWIHTKLCVNFLPI